MKTVSVIGKFHTAAGVSDGQAIKTNILADELGRVLGEETLSRINTYGWKKNPIRLFFRSIKAVRKSANVVFMTDEGGIKIFPWLLQLANIGGKCSIHYVVVGGWLDHRLAKSSLLCWILKGLDFIYVETNTMKKALEIRDFQNVILMPNCKRLPSLTLDELSYAQQEPYRLCIFSRIMQEKGIDEAVEAVRWVNDQCGRIVFTLDIYGQVEDGQTEWFQKLRESFPSFIRYCGVADYRESVAVLKSNFALLFPTRFYTEGIPGTIIDAYAAGVPVIASAWESWADVIGDETGIVYEFKNQEALKNTLLEVATKPDILLSKKTACLRKAKEYTPEAVMEILISRLRAD